MPFKTGVLLVCVVTLSRVALLRFDTTDLFVDEAQYWLWGQNLEFGYFSKPPMIAWVIRAVTALFSSDDRFFVRLPGPLFHMATALLLMFATRRLGYERLCGMVGAAYITLPGVALSSYLFSTDVILLTFYALATLCVIILSRRRSAGWAVTLGVAVGLGLLSKYAMIYVVLCTALAALFLPSARIAARDASIAAFVAFILIAPNLWWNWKNGGTTFRHTADNAGWSGSSLHPRAMAEFFLAQFGVIGPVLFAALLLGLLRALRRQASQQQTMLLIWSLPILAILMVQALMSRAYANWGATAYIAGTILAVIVLDMYNRRALFVSFMLNGAVTVLLPLATVFAHQLVLPNGHLAMQRYLGRSDLSRQVDAIATDAGLTAVVSDNRDSLADLFYTLRDGSIALYARPPAGKPANFYEQRHALPADYPGPVLFVTLSSLQCAAGDPVLLKSWTPPTGFLHGRQINAYRTQASCLTP